MKKIKRQLKRISNIPYHHFSMLCFTDKELPWYLTVYKNFLGYVWFGGIVDEFREWKENRKLKKNDKLRGTK